MKIFKIVLLLLLITGLQAKGAKWQNLKKIYKYSTSDFHLKEDVSVMEIRRYGTYDNYKKYNTPTIEMKFYKTAHKLLDPKLVKRFKNSAPNLSKSGNIHRTSNTSVEISNAFIIDSSGDILKMNEIVDVIGYMGEIDTPAEAQLILWLHSKREGTKYRKISRGYEIIIKYYKSYPSDGGDKKIAEICEESREVRDKAVINSKGKIVSYKQVYIAKKGSISCIHPAQNIVDGVYQ